MKSSEEAIKWFRNNSVIENTNKKLIVTKSYKQKNLKSIFCHIKAFF